MLKRPQSQICGFADGQESGGHCGPALAKRHLKQSSQDPTSILWWPPVQINSQNTQPVHVLTYTYTHSYSEISESRCSEIGHSLYKGHSLRPKILFPIVPIHFEPPKEDNLLTKDKRGRLKCLLLRGFTTHLECPFIYCIEYLGTYVQYEYIHINMSQPGK